MIYRGVSYRDLFQYGISPILEFCDHGVNKDFLIVANIDYKCATIGDKILYVPENGGEFYNLKNNPEIDCFNPFKSKDHVVVLIAKMFLSGLEKYLEYQNFDPTEEDQEKIKLDLRNRPPKREDNLPANFNGLVYEIVTDDEDEETISIVHYPSKDHIKALLTLAYNFLRSRGKLDARFDPDKLFSWSDRVHKKLDEEMTYFKSIQETSNSNVFYTAEDPDILDVDLKDGEDEIVDIESSDQDEFDDDDMFNMIDLNY